MKTVLRWILGVVAGIALAFVLVVAVELFSAVVHPVPPDFAGTMEEMCQHVARYPDWVLGIAVIAWSAIAFVSICVATRIGQRTGGLVVALVLAGALVLNISMLPYALWFKVVMLSCFAAAAYLGFRRGAALIAQGRRQSSVAGGLVAGLGWANRWQAIRALRFQGS